MVYIWKLIYMKWNLVVVSLSPDDIADLSESDSDMFKLIRDWKRGLTDVIVKNGKQTQSNF